MISILVVAFFGEENVVDALAQKTKIEFSKLENSEESCFNSYEYCGNSSDFQKKDIENLIESFHEAEWNFPDLVVLCIYGDDDLFEGVVMVGRSIVGRGWS